MNLPLGITLTLLLILQTFQQVSTQIPEEWERNNMAMDINETQSSENPSVSIGESAENSEAKLEESSEFRSSEGESFGSFFFTEGDEQKQNSTTLYQIPDHKDNDTEEANSGGPIATTPPPMIALNSSSDPSDTSAESTAETQTATYASTPEPEDTNQSALNDTYTSPKPETNTTESSLYETGSGYLPSDDVPTNSTTKSPAPTTKDESVQYNTTVSPTEPPVYRTTTPEIPPAIPEDITTPAPNSENTGADPVGPFDNRDNSERGLSSDVKDATENRKGQAWAIVLGVGIIVGIIALAAFIILNRRNRRDFSHRKLVEETSPDPVLRLDNSEPLDLKFDGYYNPGLQRDNIQMTNFPQGQTQ